MMQEIKFWKLTYPKGYRPGMEYKKRVLGKTYFSELLYRTIGIDNVIWKMAARLRITCDVDAFDIRELGEPYPWYCGNV